MSNHTGAKCEPKKKGKAMHVDQRMYMLTFIGATGMRLTDDPTFTDLESSLYTQHVTML